jgi:hypothetical protein
MINGLRSVLPQVAQDENYDSTAGNGVQTTSGDEPTIVLIS